MICWCVQFRGTFIKDWVVLLARTCAGRQSWDESFYCGTDGGNFQPAREIHWRQGISYFLFQLLSRDPLDWVLSHWAHFTVHTFICVYFVCFCFILHSCCFIVSMVGWTWWDWRLILRTYLSSVLWHCWLGHLTCKNPSPIWPIMCLVGRSTCEWRTVWWSGVRLIVY